MHFFADLYVFLHVMTFVIDEGNNRKAVGEHANVIWKMKDFFFFFLFLSISTFFTYSTLTSANVM